MQPKDRVRVSGAASPTAASRDIVKDWLYDARGNLVVLTVSRLSTGEIIRQVPQQEIVEITATLRDEARQLILEQKG